jgi:hypothetical protein
VTGHQSGDFAVRVVSTERDLWRVILTLNGDAWQGLGVSFSDEGRARRVADFLREELAPEAARMYREIQDAVRAS